MRTRHPLESAGLCVARYGLVLVLLWIGGMKFTEVEAKAIKPMVENSPLLSWVYGPMSVTDFAKALGVVEIIIGLMIALRPVAIKVSAFGSILGVVMFLTTLSFIITTPGWEKTLGFPALSVTPGQFLLKDIVLLGVSLLTAGEALAADQTVDAKSENV